MKRERRRDETKLGRLHAKMGIFKKKNRGAGAYVNPQVHACHEANASDHFTLAG